MSCGERGAELQKIFNFVFSNECQDLKFIFFSLLSWIEPMTILRQKKSFIKDDKDDKVIVNFPSMVYCGECVKEGKKNRKNGKTNNNLKLWL